jgi:hypothetical protein
MNESPVSQADPKSWFNGNQWAAVEKMRAEDAQEIYRLRRRIESLEGCLIYSRNFLPQPLKAQAEEILWPANRQDPSSV